MTNPSLTTALMVLTLLCSGAAAFLIIYWIIGQLERAGWIGSLRAHLERQDAAGTRAQGSARGRANRLMQRVGDVIVSRVGDLLTPWIPERTPEQLRRRFMAMGQPDYRLQDFIAQIVLYTLFFGLLGLMVVRLIKRPWPLAIPFFIFGTVFPFIWLRDRIRQRHKAISRALSYHIDLLTLAVEAGLDFAQALGTVVERGQPGALIDELRIMLSEMRLGKTREEALHNVSDRVQLPELSSFIANLIQADRLGTSLGKVLRIQSSQLRTARIHRAEKAANEAPLKVLLPLVLCFFPTVFIILFGPIVYRFIYGG